MRVKPLKLFIIIVLSFTLIIFLGFKLFSTRHAISRERFVEYMNDNGYYVASGFIYTSGDTEVEVEDNSTKKKDFVMDITAIIDDLNVKIDFYEYADEQDAINDFTEYCTEIRNDYFFKQANHELAVLTYKADYVKETSGSNYSRYIIRNPDRNVTSIVSRIDNTIILVRDNSDLSYYKVRDSLGSIGY